MDRGGIKDILHRLHIEQHPDPRSSMTMAPIKSGFEKSPTLKAENSQLRIVQTFVSWQLIAPRRVMVMAWRCR